MNDEDYQRWHNHALDYLINLNRKDSNIKFWLRRQNRELRLDKGFWFPGSDYIVLSALRIGDGQAKVKSLALIVAFDKLSIPYCFLQLQYKSETNKKIIDFYQDLLTVIKFEKVNQGKLFRKYYVRLEVVDAINQFWYNDLKIVEKLVKKHELQEYFFIDSDDFEKSLQRIIELRKIREEKANDASVDPEILSYPEGKQREGLAWHKSKERSRKFVAEYKYKYRDITNCPACKIAPIDIYNIAAINFFELHHIIPLSKREEEYNITEEDVILLCPNCHRAIHKLMSLQYAEYISLKDFQEYLEEYQIAALN